jgi:phosphoglycolate phosphatase
MLYKAMGVLGIDRLVYVGDGEGDVTTAHNAGAKCVSVLWGFRDEEELVEAGADFLCRQVSDLTQLIEQAVNEE